MDGKAAPRLAEKWTWENGFRSLRLTLRSGVTFHDGTALNSARVATALRQLVSRPGNQALYPSLSDITEIRPNGELELVIDLSRPSAFLPEDLDLSLGIGSETGPYQPVGGTAPEVAFERFEGYYLGTPKIARIEVRPFDTLRTAWTSLLRGELDMVTDVPPDAVQFIGSDDIQIISFERRYQYLIAFNSKKSPFDKAAVRRALNLAVNRDALVKNVLQGRGTSSTGPLWPTYWAYDRSVAPYSFDPALAMSLLDGAGYEAGGAPRSSESETSSARLRFTCLIPAGFAIWERIALEVQKNLYAIGVDMQFKVVPVQEFDTLFREGSFDAALIDMISGPTPSRAYIFWQSARRHKGLNIFGYENPEAERLFEVLRSDTNEGAVRSTTRRLQTVFLDDPPALFLAWSQRTRAVRRDFQIVQEPNRDPLLTLWRWTPSAGTPANSTP